ncbi:prolyl oligopeptidase family serine peptidase [Cellulophaga lytica]|uniref:BAAT/Acyl-CoA thioester hydrolase n=2 Tax=Cellulophaga TaxID=104264 RepID=F0RDK0_CELLC|nr:MULTISPECIES: acyl-CoA thioester hydrolase/BAAT C-terminal domain-containing protein [Cellulophaga]ADY28748.1 BAAT/Acyl-CoA thioester hydrolase [Cellulophaga lytica DSM 7489]EWH12985.1 BAAT/Acyl-CoA thioester hydrolase [Cellulophaga geojensis KL-A]WQG77071.1 acyl-CoA thioester hydrolase/BAAT C-terminal domain-containing protein [Cellulophaga lytica]
MKKRTKRILLILTLALISGIVYIFTYIPNLSKQHGVVETLLYLGDSENQPLIVAFGGAEGGIDWHRNHMKSKRDSLIQKGYAILAIGYFNSEGTPKNLDRISLDAISDTIINIAKKNSKINESKIALIGGSRGGELVLNLASRFDHFNAVIAMSTSNVSFPAITWSANTSSWTFKGKDVPYVPAPLKTISPALKGDLFTAHKMMLEDKKALKKAEIEVENINGAILILSGKTDDQWPASEMSDQLIQRLKNKKFKHYNKHIAIDGGHIAPLEHFNLVYDFLDKHLPTE